MPNRVSYHSEVPQVVERLRDFLGHSVRVGVFGEAGSHMVIIAAAQEFGAKIPADTASAKGRRVRGWLGAHGLYLRAETKFVNIPPRSYLRSTAFKSSLKEGVEKIIRSGLQALIRGVVSAEALWGRIGAFAAAEVQKTIAEGMPDWAPLHPFTVEMKGGERKPLTGRALRQAITWKVT